MEQNNHKFRLRLNLFDAVVLLVILVAGAALVWFGLRGSADAVSQETVRYTVLFQRMREGSGALVQPGDQLVDTIKNYRMGTVVSTEITQAQIQTFDQEEGVFRMVDVPGYEDVYVTVDSPCTTTVEELLLDGGYDLRVGQTTYVRGPGYMGSGPVTEIVREVEG